jgi:phage FluMu protein Com
MSIEFNCSQCGKLLRVGDDAAGKQARCPSCGTVQSIPFPSASGAGNFPAAVPNESPFGRAGEVASPPPIDPTNPYASPMSLPDAPPTQVAGEYWGPRTGPPWERDGASLSSFWATTKLAYSSPQFLFRDMRREGGFAAPLLYAIAGAAIGGVVALCYNIGFQVVMMQVVGNVGNRPGMAGPPMSPAMSIPLLIVIGIIGIPLGAVIQSFVGGGIYHVCLMLLGGARQPYETTFRVVCYASGSASLLALIPICGPYLQGIVSLVFTGMGLAYAHETTGVKATFAVLLPVIVCCGAAIVLYGTIIGLVIANAR